MRGVKQDAMERFEERVERSEGCWLWTGAISTSGYPTFNPESGAKVYAHRWLYEETVGRIEPGLQLDHLCFVPTCVNPAHLEVVTPEENKRRRRINSATHCRAGHPWTPENTYVRPDKGTRMCQSCQRLKYERSTRKQQSSTPTRRTTS